MTDFKPLDLSKQPQPQQEPDVRANLYQARDIDPEQAARAQAVGRERGVPASVVRADPQSFEKFRGLDPEVIANSRALARAASTPEGAASIKDDEQLGVMDRFFADAKRQLQRDIVDPLSRLGRAGAAGVVGDLPSGASGVVETAATALSEYVGKPIAGVIGQGNPFERLAELARTDRRAFARLGEQVQGDLTGASTEEQAVLGGIRSFGMQLPSMIAFRSPVGAAAGVSVPVAGSEGARALEAGVDPATALMYGLSQGGVEMVTEAIPFARFFGDLKADAPLLKTLLNNQLVEQPGEQIATVWQDLNEWAVLNPDKTLNEFLAERPEAARQTAIATLAQGVVQTGSFRLMADAQQQIEMRREAIRAQGAAEYVQQVAKIADATKIKARDPKVLADIVQGMAEDAGAPTHVYIDPSDLADVLAQSKMTLDQFAAMMPEASNEIIDGFLEQSTVRIPVGELVARVSGTPIEEALTQRLRMTEDGMTPAQAGEFLQSSYNDQVQAEAERILAGVEEAAPFRAASEQLRQRVEAELVQAGQPADVARKNAMLTSAYFTVAANDWQQKAPGTTALDLFNRFYGDGRPMVAGGPAPAQAAAGGALEQTDPQSPEFRAWFGDSKVVDAEGKPLVVYHGTGRDTSEFTYKVGRGKTLGRYYFAADSRIADEYGGTADGANTMPVYLSLKNPLDIDYDGGQWASFPLSNLPANVAALIPEKSVVRGKGDQAFVSNAAIATAAESAGYDGLITRNVKDGAGTYGEANASDVYIAFRPEQIKSVFNRGTFDPADPNILNQGDRRQQAGVASAPQASVEYANGQQILESRLQQWASSIDLDGRGGVGIVPEEWAEPSRYQGERGRPAFGVSAAEGLAEQARLIEAAKSNGFFFEAGHPIFAAITANKNQGGAEHDAYIVGVEQQRVVIRTTANGEFGNESVASPVAYLQRLQTYNRAFPETQTRVIGVSQNDDGNAVIITAQTFVPGEEFKSQLDLDNAMRARGWYSFMGSSNKYFNKKTGAVIDDVHPGNVLHVGEQLFPIDVVVVRWPESAAGAGESAGELRQDVVRDAAEIIAYGRLKDLRGDRSAAIANLKGEVAALERRLQEPAPAWMEDGAREKTLQQYKDALRLLEIGAIEVKRPAADESNETWQPDDDLLAAAVEVFGTTSDPKEAGYVLPDGSMLDFTGRHYSSRDNWQYLRGQRSVDHRELQSENTNTGASLQGMLQSSGSEGMYEFMARTGAMRIDAASGVASISRPPTAQQIAAIGNARKGKYLALSYNRPDGEIVLDGEFESANPMKVRKFFDEAQKQEGGTGILAQESRGTYSPSSGLIRVLARADFSTFLHESGHQFLDLTVKMAAMPDAPDAVKKRADNALAWLGIPSTPEVSRTDAWLMMTLEEQRPYHEKWAETFEAYLFTGKAPSLDLAEAFRAFKDWLKSVYRSIKQFLQAHPDASLDDEVRAVMDRMLATDEQIAEAEASRAVIPLFDRKPESMSAELWAKYQADLERMRGESAEVIDQKRLADMKWLRAKGGKVLREAQKDAAEKRRQTRMEAAREILQQPVYQLRQMLEAKYTRPAAEKKAKGLDTSVDSLTVAIAKLGGINREQAVAEWGLDPADFKDLGPFGKPVLRANGGMAPGEIIVDLAELGYLPVDEHGKADMNKLADLLDLEARGDKQYSFEADWSRLLGDGFAPVPNIEDNPFAGARLEHSWFIRNHGGPVADAMLAALGKMVEKPQHAGVNPDALAPLFGFSSGEEMVNALLASRPTQDAIDRLTDQKMLEKYGDIESPAAMKELVDKAIMSKARARIVASEMTLIDKALGKPADLARAAREAAAAILDQVKVVNIRPDKYKLAAARSGRDARAALAKGNTNAVLVAKRGQLLNVELFNLATDARAEVDKFQSDTRDWFGSDEKLAKSRNMDMVSLARSILADYGLATDAQTERAESAMARIAEYNAMGAADLASIVEGLPDRVPFKELTWEEMRAVMTVAKAVWHLARHDKKVELSGQQYEADAIAAELVEAFGAPGEGALSTKGRLDRVFEFFSGAWATLRIAESWFDTFDPVVKKVLYRPLRESVVKHLEYRHEKVRQYRDLLAGLDLPSGSIAAPELGRGVDGRPVTLVGGKRELLHAILHTGNESNKRKLLLGRKWAELRPDGSVDTSRWDAFMARMFAEGRVTKADMDFAQGVWDLLESMKPDAQATHYRLYGYYFDEITASPVQTPFGEYRGGYVPAVADRADPEAGAKVDADELLHAGNSFMFPTAGRGFTKARVEFNRPLELDLGLLTSHIDKVSRFVHIEPAMRETAKLLNRSDVKGAIEAQFPGATAMMLNPFLQGIARQTTTVPSSHKWVDKTAAWTRSTSGAAMMFANIVNTAQQLTGLLLATTKVPAPAMGRALWYVMRQPVSASQHVKNRSGFMKTRMEEMQFTMETQVQRILLGDGILDNAEKAKAWIDEHAYFMQSFMQNRVDTVVWLAAYDTAKRRGSETPEADADEAVRLTQASFEPGDMASISTGTPMWRSMVMFYSYFGMMLNNAATTTKKVMAEESGMPVKAAKLLALYAIVYGGTNALAEAIARGLPDDDDDEDGDGLMDDYLAFYFGSNRSAALASIPLVGAAAAPIIARLEDKPYNERLMVSPSFAYAERALSGLATIGVPDEEGDGELSVTEMKQILATIGIMGVPTGQVAKTAGFLMKMDEGSVAPEGPVETAVGLARGF